MPSLNPTLRKVNWFGFGLAGSLVGAVRRRDGSRRRRVPDRLLVKDASGSRGPALVAPVADYDVVLLPAEVGRAQAMELAVAASKSAIHGAGRRVHDLLATGPGRVVPEESRHGDDPPTSPAERAAWERFVVALEWLTAVQAAYALDPEDLGVESMRWAEVELEDAVAVAGEFEVKNIRWLLT